MKELVCFYDVLSLPPSWLSQTSPSSRHVSLHKLKIYAFIFAEFTHSYKLWWVGETSWFVSDCKSCRAATTSLVTTAGILLFEVVVSSADVLPDRHQLLLWLLLRWGASNQQQDPADTSCSRLPSSDVTESPALVLRNHFRSFQNVYVLLQVYQTVKLKLFFHWSKTLYLCCCHGYTKLGESN